MDTLNLKQNDIMDGSENGKPYYQLLDALRTAALDEGRLTRFLQETKRVKGASPLLATVGETTTVLLPGCMGRLIGTLDLHNAFLSLGRYIRSFADAEFVVIKLKVPLIEKMGTDGPNSLEVANRLILCCNDFSKSVSALMQFTENP